MKYLAEAKKILKRENLHARKDAEIGKDEVEFALAWARGEISLGQATLAWQRLNNKAHGMGVYVLLARSLRKFIKENNV